MEGVELEGGDRVDLIKTRCIHVRSAQVTKDAVVKQKGVSYKEPTE